jgi:hypothetical protein
MIWAILDEDKSVVENLIIWDGQTPIPMSDRAVFVRDEDDEDGQIAGIGWSYLDGTFINPSARSASDYSEVDPPVEN